MFEAIPLFPGGVPGGTELVVILLIAVLLFGANKIPKLARSTGQAMGEFQKGRQQVEEELEKMQEGASLDELGDDETGSETTSTTTETSTETASSSDTSE
jgi:sec-independent protein translocase protein TatA